MFDNPYDEAEFDQREEERAEARRQRREDDGVDEWKAKRFESQKRTYVFYEATGRHILTLEFASQYSDRMIGVLKNDLGVFDQLRMGKPIDAPDCIPCGCHRRIDAMGQPIIVGQKFFR